MRCKLFQINPNNLGCPLVYYIFMNNTKQYNKIKLSKKEKKAIYDKEYLNKNREEKLKKRRERANSLEYKEKRKIYIEKNKNTLKQKKAEYDRKYRKK